jgi:hypothetical protein
MAMLLNPGSPEMKINQGWLYALMGRRKEAEGVLKGLTGEPLTVRWLATVEIRQALGDMDTAFEALMQMAEHHSWYPYIWIDPLYENLRKDPRFSEFCRKVGLPA